MDQSHALQQARNSAVLVAPILERALHDRKTRRALRDVAVRSLSRRTNARVVHAAAAAASPVTAWLKSVERDQRRRDHRRWFLAGIGALGAVATLIAVRMRDRSHGSEIDGAQVTVDANDHVAVEMD